MTALQQFAIRYRRAEIFTAIQIIATNTNIASKVFQIFSQMAKTNFSIAVDEDNVKDLSTTEWRARNRDGLHGG